MEIIKDSGPEGSNTVYRLKLDPDTAVTNDGSGYCVHLLFDELEELRHLIREEVLFDGLEYCK